MPDSYKILGVSRSATVDEIHVPPLPSIPAQTFHALGAHLGHRSKHVPKLSIGSAILSGESNTT